MSSVLYASLKRQEPIQQERALGIVGTTVFSLFPLLPQLSLWCAGGNLSLLSHFLFSLFFSLKSSPTRRARTPDKHGAIEGAEVSWSSELLRVGVGLPKPNPRGHKNQSAWFVGVCESSQVNTPPKAKSKTRSKQNKDMHKYSSVYSKRGLPLPVLTSGGE